MRYLVHLKLAIGRLNMSIYFRFIFAVLEHWFIQNLVDCVQFLCLNLNWAS